MRYLIVATGPSVKEVVIDSEALPDDVKVVAVNAAIEFVKNPDIWFTLDPSQRNIRYAQYCVNNNIPVVMACGDDVMLPDGVIRMARYGNRPVRWPAPKSPEQWFHRWGCKPGLSDDLHGVNTGNSAYGALNLVYWDSPDRVAILGLDANQKPSYSSNHKPYNLSHLPILFDSSKNQLTERGISVINGSLESKIDTFPKMSPNNAIQWLLSDR